MIKISEFIASFPEVLAAEFDRAPWRVIREIKHLLERAIDQLDDDFRLENGNAIHRSAVIEKGATLKAPVVISAHCRIGANAYLREGVYLAANVKIGPGCEIKSSIVCSGSAIAHLNYIGNSIIGSRVNFEAGAIAANHYNERDDKEISVFYGGKIVPTGVVKFGAIVGDDSRVGANAVLSPGTLLPRRAVVKRLELVEQVNPESTGK